MAGLAHRQFPSLVNWLLQKAQGCSFVGKYRLFRFMQRHFSGKVIKYNIKQKPFYVPVEEWCFWLEGGPQNYYPDDINPFAARINQMQGDVLFVDCGADIGTVSMMVSSRLADVASKEVKFVCIEPNPNAFELLTANEHAISNNLVLCPYAVSNFNGTAQLKFRANLTSDHEAHIDMAAPGNTRVVTLDALSLELGLSNAKNLVLKVDVEGQEQAVFDGAAALIKQAESCVVLLELHPDVLERDKQTAEDILAAAEKLAAFTWTIPELNNRPVDRSTDFFSQVPRKQYDVMGCS